MENKDKDKLFVQNITKTEKSEGRLMAIKSNDRTEKINIAPDGVHIFESEVEAEKFSRDLNIFLNSGSIRIGKGAIKKPEHVSTQTAEQMEKTLEKESGKEVEKQEVKEEKPQIKEEKPEPTPSIESKEVEIKSKVEKEQVNHKNQVTNTRKNLDKLRKKNKNKSKK